jgi:hypothetical protein
VRKIEHETKGLERWLLVVAVGLSPLANGDPEYDPGADAIGGLTPAGPATSGAALIPISKGAF